MGPLELVAILATRWRHLPFASRTFCHHMMPHPLFAHFGHQMELLALIANLATRRHHLHQLQIGSPSGTTCIGSKFGHQLAPFALLPKLATRLHHCIATLPWIALLALSVSIELVSSSARVTSVKSTKGLLLSDIRTQRSDQGHLGPIKTPCIFYCCWKISVGIELVSSSARVTSVKSQHSVGVWEIRTHRSDPRDTWVR